MKVRQAAGDVVSQRELHLGASHDGFGRQVEERAQAAVLRELHEEADPVGLAKDHTPRRGSR